MNLHHIESRPSKQSQGDYDFFVSCDDSQGGLKEAIDDLKEMSKMLTILSRNMPSTTVENADDDSGE